MYHVNYCVYDIYFNWNYGHQATMADEPVNWYELNWIFIAHDEVLINEDYATIVISPPQIEYICNVSLHGERQLKTSVRLNSISDMLLKSLQWSFEAQHLWVILFHTVKAHWIDPFPV